MTRSVRLPAAPVADTYANRLVAELTLILRDTAARLEAAENALRVETDLGRAPERDGALAVVGGEAYIGVAGVWRQITT